MSTLSLPQLPATPPKPDTLATPRVLFIGNPNTGKTTLFNALSGLRAKTANFAGTTVEHRRATVPIAGRTLELIDLPGLYGLDAASPEERVAEDALRGTGTFERAVNLVVLVLDATNLEQNLYLAGEVAELNLPTVAVLNQMDAAHTLGIDVKAERIAQRLNCPVVEASGRTGLGLDALRRMMIETLVDEPAAAAPLASCSCTAGCRSCPIADRYEWAKGVADESGNHAHIIGDKATDAIDRILTHPVVGVMGFALVMAGLFYLIFALATWPMGWIEAGFTWAGETIGALLPAGDLRSLVVDGLIGGVGGVLVFLPQIVILFFFITLLEDTGYLARAAFVMEKLMRRVGLPGKAFVPMLSAHACAIPGLMATRTIENPRDRLATILVLPLMTCSARLPVYAMIAALLFGGEPFKASLLFLAAYLVGIAAALIVAGLFKLTILRGKTQPMVIELPRYRLPSLKNAVMSAYDRGMIFVKKAGTVILLISLVLWALATYPKMPEDAMPPQAAVQIEKLEASAGDAISVEDAQAAIDGIIAEQELGYSVAGRLGRLVEPVFAPLGYDWKVSVGVVTSFAAREVVVSTLGVLYGVGDDTESDSPALIQTLRAQTHADGTRVFTTAMALSLLVFFVLAMQCLPTQAVTARETGSWKWAIFQLGYMSLLAYGTALIVFQVASAAGLG